MSWRALHFLGALLLAVGVSLAAESNPAGASAGSAGPAVPKAGAVRRIHVIPVREQIGSAVHYVVRRGLKEAISQQADAVILDLKTPGGSLDSTFEIMEAIAQFPGPVLTYVNDEAMSAGAFIAATTREIWFAPNGIIGAAAPVSSGGQDVDATMKQKIVSYLRARIRSLSEGHPYRGQVISAMIDANLELKVGERVIKPKGELLSLTASEASESFGDPPQPLLAAGIAKSVDDLISQRFPGAHPEVIRMRLTWSESLAVWLNAVSPLLLGLGILALYLEFKTPGFGLFGVAGAVLLGVVFLSSYLAGLSGHEPILVFGAGLLLLAAEIFFLPGIVVLALTGIALMLGSLVWAMADLWPNQPLQLAWSGDAFVAPLANLGLGLTLAVGLALALARFLPRSWVWDRLVVQGAVDGTAQAAGSGISSPDAALGLVGRTGLAVTPLRPSGQVEIDGRRYEARVELGGIESGQRVVVRGVSDFGLRVEASG